MMKKSEVDSSYQTKSTFLKTALLSVALLTGAASGAASAQTLEKCPEAKDIKLSGTKWDTTQSGWKAKGDFSGAKNPRIHRESVTISPDGNTGQIVSCEYADANVKNTKPSFTLEKGLTQFKKLSKTAVASAAANMVIPSLEVTPAVGRNWNPDNAGTALVCKTEACDFKVAADVPPALESYIMAKIKLYGLLDRINDFKDQLFIQSKPVPGGTNINFKELIYIVDHTRYTYRGNVPEENIFTFASSEGEKAREMANNLGWNPMKSVITDMNFNLAVVPDMTPYNHIFTLLEAGKKMQEANQGFLTTTQERDMKDLINSYIKTLQDSIENNAFKFLDQHVE